MEISYEMVMVRKTCCPNNVLSNKRTKTCSTRNKNKRLYEADNYFHIKIFNFGQNISKKSKKFIKIRED